MFLNSISIGKKQWKRIQNDEIANARENWKRRHWLLIAIGSYIAGIVTKLLIHWPQ